MISKKATMNHKERSDEKKDPRLILVAIRNAKASTNKIPLIKKVIDQVGKGRKTRTMKRIVRRILSLGSRR